LPALAAPRLVYVLENDRISSVITELIVKKHLSGGEVRCYPNGQAAFQELSAAVQLNSEVPDLILLDLDMPLMDGWEFLEALDGLSAAHGVCVFVLTSSIHPDDSARATGYRAVNGFFTKPLDEDSIVRMQVLLQEGHAQAVSAALAPMAAALDAVNYPHSPLPGAATAAQP
jgi:CheY-like chemotaxis protein